MNKFIKITQLAFNQEIVMMVRADQVLTLTNLKQLKGVETEAETSLTFISAPNEVMYVKETVTQIIESILGN